MRGGARVAFAGALGPTRTSGGTHRSRPTNHVGSSSVFVGTMPTSSRRQRVSFTGVLGRTRTSGGGKPPPYAVGTNQPVMWFLVHTGGTCFDGAVCGPTPQGGFSWPVGPIHLLWASAPTGCVRITDHPIDQTPGGAGGPLALAPQQCEAWIECAAALIPA